MRREYVYVVMEEEEEKDATRNILVNIHHIITSTIAI